MKKAENLRFRKWDLCAIAAVLLLGAVVFVAFLPRNSAQNATVQIYLEGNLIHELPLSDSCTLHIDGAYHNTVVIENGAVQVTASDCPGEDCVHSGRISQTGRNIVCLPNRMEVRIVGSGGIDAVVR